MQTFIRLVVHPFLVVEQAEIVMNVGYVRFYRDHLMKLFIASSYFSLFAVFNTPLIDFLTSESPAMSIARLSAACFSTGSLSIGAIFRRLCEEG